MTQAINFKLKSWKVFSNCLYLLKADIVPAKQIVWLLYLSCIRDGALDNFPPQQRGPVASLLNMIAC